MVQECVDSYRIHQSAMVHSSFLCHSLPVRPCVFAVGPRNTRVLHRRWRCCSRFRNYHGCHGLSYLSTSHSLGLANSDLKEEEMVNYIYLHAWVLVSVTILWCQDVLYRFDLGLKGFQIF